MVYELDDVRFVGQIFGGKKRKWGKNDDDDCHDDDGQLPLL